MVCSNLGLFELGLGNVQRALALMTEASINRSGFDEGTLGSLMPRVLLRTGTASVGSVMRQVGRKFGRLLCVTMYQRML